MRKPKNKKRIRKPHSMHKRMQNRANQTVKTFAVAYVTGRDKCDIIDTITCKPFPATLTHARAFTEYAHQWSMFMAALGIDDQGRHYLKAEQIFLTDRRKQADLVEAFNDHHQQFIRTAMNPRHLVGAAWIGSPEGADISEQQAMDIFTALGAWDEHGEQAA